MEKWIEVRKGGPFKEIADKYGIDPVLARIMRNRGITGDDAIRQYLHGSLDDMEDPLALDDISKAADLLYKKISEGKKIRVIGDYDIDGVCASFILVRSLRVAGADADYAIPERMKDGYGLNRRLIEDALACGTDTILTCDNGISAIEEIAFAKDNGMTVIVTDHHEPVYKEDENGDRRYILPCADLIVDPKRPGCGYPNKELCGAALAWKLISLYESKYMSDADNSAPALSLSMLPFAGFATVGDIMELKGENRILVKTALKMLPQTDNYGMKALIRACKLEGKTISAYHIGFILGPCINAGGRIETAELAMRLFLSDNPDDADSCASRLLSLNEERKEMTLKGCEKALETASISPMDNDKVLVIYLPDTHESIAGIIAGKVRESTGKPCIILTKAREEGCLKGSGRSIEEYHLFDALVECDDLLLKYGGHALAAGLSLKEENLEAFRKKLNEKCTLTEDDLAGKVKIDMQMPVGYISEKLIDDLSLLEPFGKGNEKPLFAALSLNLLSARIMGQNRNVLKLRVADKDGAQIDAISFSDADRIINYLTERYGASACRKLMAGRGSDMKISLVYQPDINEYRGIRSPQLIIKYFR